jgi:hypothetical protein
MIIIKEEKGVSCRRGPHFKLIEEQKEEEDHNITKEQDNDNNMGKLTNRNRRTEDKRKRTASGITRTASGKEDTNRRNEKMTRTRFLSVLWIRIRIHLDPHSFGFLESGSSLGMRIRIRIQKHRNDQDLQVNLVSDFHNAFCTFISMFVDLYLSCKNSNFCDLKV